MKQDKKKGKKTDRKIQREDSQKSVDLKDLMRAMEKCQDFKRYQHTLGVEFTAAAMAMKYGVPIRSAQIAGLLHDCAKCLSDRKKLSICEKNNLDVTELERRNPYLLHSKAGSFLAKSQYHVEDPDILNAIRYHTTGRPGMSPLEKIIFIADYIEPGRKQAPNLSEVRALAFENLDAALIRILSDTLRYLKEGGGEIDPMTRKTYDYYCKEEK